MTTTRHGEYRRHQKFTITEAKSAPHHFAPGTPVTLREISLLKDGSINGLLVRGRRNGQTIVQWVSVEDLSPVKEDAR